MKEAFGGALNLASLKCALLFRAWGHEVILRQHYGVLVTASLEKKYIFSYFGWTRDSLVDDFKISNHNMQKPNNNCNDVLFLLAHYFVHK